MEFTVQTLKRILPQAEFVLDDGLKFDYLNIAHNKKFENLARNNILYFCVYEDQAEKDGWYDDNFDRARNLPGLSDNKSLAFLIDRHTNRSLVENKPHIWVENIFQAIDALRRYALSSCKPKVVGVTGSVGKTTTVSMIEDVVAGKYPENCLRIFSKRLTPLNLSSEIVNFVGDQTRFVFMEYAMYRPEHIGKLKEIVPPDISVFLNARPVHLGVRGIDSMKDIIAAKSSLFSEAGCSIVNNDESAWKTLARRDYKFGFNEEECDIWPEFIRDDLVRLRFKEDNGVVEMSPPYLMTKLYFCQVMASALVGRIAGVDNWEIELSINDFQPKENRIGWTLLFGRKVLFDGEMTQACRLGELADNYYGQPSILVIHSLNFGIENINLQLDSFKKTFSGFNEVRIMDSDPNISFLKEYGISPKNISIMNPKDVFYGLPERSFVVYHFGGFFRRYQSIKELEAMF